MSIKQKAAHIQKKSSKKYSNLLTHVVFFDVLEINENVLVGTPDSSLDALHSHLH